MNAYQYHHAIDYAAVLQRGWFWAIVVGAILLGVLAWNRLKHIDIVDAHEDKSEKAFRYFKERGRYARRLTNLCHVVFTIVVMIWSLAESFDGWDQLGLNSLSANDSPVYSIIGTTLLWFCFGAALGGFYWVVVTCVDTARRNVLMSQAQERLDKEREEQRAAASDKTEEQFRRPTTDFRPYYRGKHT